MARVVSHTESGGVGKSTQHVGTLCVQESFSKSNTPSDPTHIEKKEEVKLAAWK